MKKLLKYKQLLIGIIIGSMVTFAIPVKAAIQEYILYKADYRIVVNDKVLDLSNTDTPPLNYKGYTYLPSRIIAESLGVDLIWRADIKQVEMTNQYLIDSIETTFILPPEITRNPKTTDTSVIGFTQDGTSVCKFDGDETLYISAGSLPTKASRMFDNKEIDDYYYLGVDIIPYEENYETCKLYYRTRGEMYYGTNIAKTVETVILEDIPVVMKVGSSYITYDYYKEIILPVITKAQ